MTKKQKSPLLFSAVVFFGGLLSGGLIYSSTILLNVPQGEELEKVVEIPTGTTLGALAQTLKEEGIISNKSHFIILGKLTRAERQIKPGEYALNNRMDPLQILSHVKEGNVVLHEVRIPEGYTSNQIGALLNQKNLLPDETFQRLVTDTEWIKTLDIQAGTLEGYLFPDTYFFPKNVPGEAILKTMVSRYQNAFIPEWRSRIEELGWTEHEVITLASIIEKETGVDHERPLISAVFHNRIKKRIPLQSDPTVIYAIPDFNGNLTRNHLRMSSPYNTYQVRGLPPGPIANPGEKSLQAALYPADVDYLYFVSKNDGTHYFSKTLSEHNDAVQHYQVRRSSGRALKTVGKR